MNIVQIGGDLTLLLPLQIAGRRQLEEEAGFEPTRTQRRLLNSSESYINMQVRYPFPGLAGRPDGIARIGRRPAAGPPPRYSDRC